MKHKFNEIWAEQEGNKKIWKLQATNGIIVFSSKKKAMAFKEVIENGNK